MTLFTRIAQLVSGEGDRLHCEIIGAQDGQIKVRVTPDLGPTPSNATDEEAELRALMATPITVTGTPEEVDTLLDEHLAKRAPMQAGGADALSVLSAKMAEAAQKAKEAKPAAKSSGGSSIKAAAAAAPAKAKEEQAPKPTKAPTLDDSF